MSSDDWGGVVPESDREELLRTCSYQRPERGRGIFRFRLDAHNKIGPSIYRLSSRAPTAQFGRLSRLPLEIVQNIVLELDMESVLAFRQTSVSAAQAVSSVREYRLVVAYALDALCAMLRTHVANRITLRQFYRLLCERTCTFCTLYANFIYLPTTSRCCFNCMGAISLPERAGLMLIAAVETTFQLSAESLAGLSTFPNVPGMHQGIYGDFVVFSDAIKAYQNEHQGIPPPEQLLISMERMMLHAIAFLCAMPVYDPKSDKAFAGVYCEGCRLANLELENSLPQVDDGQPRRQEAYSCEGFYFHFNWCSYAQTLWALSQGLHVKSQDDPDSA